MITNNININKKMSHSDCILEEVNPSNNQKVVDSEDPIEELCTTDFHVDGCECFSKQEQYIKQLQEELDRQRKIQEEKKKQKCVEEQRQKEKEAKMEELRVKINEYAKLANEQKVIADKKYKEAAEANQLYYKFYGEYQNNVYQYKSLDINRYQYKSLDNKLKYSYSEYSLIPDLFNIIFNPNIKF
jgi:hypothetical protein